MSLIPSHLSFESVIPLYVSLGGQKGACHSCSERRTKKPCGVSLKLHSHCPSVSFPCAHSLLCPSSLTLRRSRHSFRSKHTQWIPDRVPFEEYKRNVGVDEVLLTTPEGIVLEGLVSFPFFIGSRFKLFAAFLYALLSV